MSVSTMLSLGTAVRGAWASGRLSGERYRRDNPRTRTPRVRGAVAAINQNRTGTNQLRTVLGLAPPDCVSLEPERWQRTSTRTRRPARLPTTSSGMAAPARTRIPRQGLSCRSGPTRTSDVRRSQSATGPARRSRPSDIQSGAAFVQAPETQ